MYDRIREGFGGVAPRARVLGRLALWAFVALIFVRGLGAMVPVQIRVVQAYIP